MKLKGEFVIREIAGDAVAVPVGETALTLNGMILLNPVSRVLFEQLQQETTPEKLTEAVTDRFETTPEQARADIEEFLEQLRNVNLLTE